MKFPTGGIPGLIREARERSTVYARGGQQIWCKSRADGYSPDGREYLKAVTLASFYG